MKRKRPNGPESSNVESKGEFSSPNKRRHVGRVGHGDESEDASTNADVTPSKKIKGGAKASAIQNDEATPKKQTRFASSVLNTPTKVSGKESNPPSRSLADRSARRTSARLLIKQAEDGQESENEDSQDELLAQEIFDHDEASDSGGDLPAVEQQDELPVQDTPSKKPRGRRKASSKQRAPSPPPDLPPHEHHFFQNRSGGAKASDNILPASALITHEDYYETMRAYRDPHEPELDFLHALHSRSFDQWLFELKNGFNICLYGWGSKREPLLEFASHISSVHSDSTVLIINGYNASLTLRDILTTLASTIPSLATSIQKLGSQPTDMLATILAALTRDPLATPTLLILHSIDGASLRRSAAQSILGRLASHASLQLIASADTPNFPLLWDASLRARFNWVFHDCTTFQVFDVEISGGGAGGVVDEVNALLGRSGRKMHGRGGVMYVLKSLTQSARGLFGLLVAELLSLDEAGEAGLEAEADVDIDENDELGFEDAVTPGKPKGREKSKARTAVGGGLNAAIEWRALYQKAVSQFIATNEMSFRGLLKEFHDHEMVVSRKDAVGTEMLGVPFRREELETLLEELVGDT